MHSYGVVLLVVVVMAAVVIAFYLISPKDADSRRWRRADRGGRRTSSRQIGSLNPRQQAVLIAVLFVLLIAGCVAAFAVVGGSHPSDRKLFIVSFVIVLAILMVSVVTARYLPGPKDLARTRREREK